jgi:hypothetical protein
MSITTYNNSVAFSSTIVLQSIQRAYLQLLPSNPLLLTLLTQLTQRAADRLLAYFRNYPDNILVLKACDMRLHTQSDASYCTRSRGRSNAGGLAYLGIADDPTAINGPIMVFSSVIQNVMASIGEA